MRSGCPIQSSNFAFFPQLCDFLFLLSIWGREMEVCPCPDLTDAQQDITILLHVSPFPN